jgi:Tfp pilus assembly protein PilO
VSRNYRILLAAVLAVLAVGGYWKLALAPKRAQAQDLAKQVATADAQLAQSRSLLASYQGAQGQYKANYASVVRLGKAVPSDDDTRSLLVQLDSAAKRSGANFDTLDVGTGATPATTTGAAATPVAPGAISAGSYSEMPFSLMFSGDFATLQNFLGRLQRFVTLDGDKILVDGRLMRVEGIDVEPGTDGWPALTAKIVASTYIVPDATSTASSGSAGSTTTTTPPTTTTTSTGAAADHRTE